MQFDEYLQQQLLNIENLNDRKIMRKIFESVLIPLHEYCDKKYLLLAERVLNEQEDNTAYHVYTGLIEREKYDVTTEDMLPMKKDDVRKKPIDLSAVKRKLAEKQDAELFTVYIELTYSRLKELMESKRLFQGTIRTDAGEYKAAFYLKQNRTYLEMVEEFYPVFIQNGVEWKDVCDPYLHKFFEVYAVAFEGLNGDAIEEIVIDFEELKEVISYELIPLWNLEIVSQNTNGYARPCVDRIHYEHIIFKERLGDAQYLVMNQDVNLMYLRRVNGDLLITCDAAENREWTLLKFHNRTGARYTYPVMGNVCTQENGRVIRTKAAMEKFIESLGYEAYLKLSEIQINALEEKKDTLLVIFHAVCETNVYNEDIMNYLMERLQRVYPEYNCIGRIE